MSAFAKKFNDTIFNQHNVKNEYIHTFLLTINSNQAYTTHESATLAKNEFISLLRELMSNFDECVHIYKNKSSRAIVFVDFDDIIHNLSVNTGVEIGSKLHRIHCHIILRWTTDLPYFFQIDTHKIRTFFVNSGKSFYVNVKFVKDTDDVSRYIRKQLNTF